MLHANMCIVLGHKAGLNRPARGGGGGASGNLAPVMCTRRYSRNAGAQLGHECSSTLAAQNVLLVTATTMLALEKNVDS